MNNKPTYEELEQRIQTLERDIAERKGVEKSLQESEQMFRALFEQAGGYCMLLRPTDNGIPDIVDVNEAACKAHGYTRSEMIGRPVADLDDEEGKRLCRERTKIIMSGKTLATQTNHVRKDGSVFPVAIFANKVQVAGKPPIIMTTEHDISKIRKAEEEKQRNQARKVEVESKCNQIEDELKAYERKSRAWLENSPVCTKIVDLDFNLQYMSSAGVEGLCIDDIKPYYGKPYPFEFYPQSFRDQMNKNLKTVKETGEVRTQEASVVDIDGNELWFHSTLVPVNDDDGRIDYIIVVSIDITERKRAEEELKASEKNYKQLFDSMDEMFQVLELIYDKDGNVIDYIYLQVNPAFEKLVNKSKEELIGKRVKDLFGVVEDHWLKAYERVDKTGVSENYENYGAEPDKYYNIHSWKVREKQVAITFTDITERKLAESTQRLAAVLLDSNDAITMQDFKGNITAWNRGAERMYGYTEAEALGMTTQNLVPMDKRQQVLDFTKKMTQGELVKSMETQRQTKDGKTLDVWLTVTAVKDESGAAIGIATTERDITEQHRVENELQRYRAHLEELVAERTTDLQATNKELEAFSYSIAHDLRAPLRSVTSFSQILLTDAQVKLNNNEQDSLNRVIAAGKYMAQLIDDILSLARVTRKEMQFEKVDVSTLCREEANRLQQADPDRRVYWNIRDGLKAWGDQKALAMMINNLLGNAWKFTRQTPEAHIEFGEMQDPGERVYYVKDNGVGFDMQYAPKLFRAFERLHSDSEFEGTGIGLATVRHIIERHCGRVWAQAAVGEGTTIYFHLPTNVNEFKNNSGIFSLANHPAATNRSKKEVSVED